MKNDKPEITIIRDPKATYPTIPPYHPNRHYPENPFRGKNRTDPDNKVYPMVRQALRSLRLDERRYGTPAWNPLGGFIKPGDRVLLKPNFVRDFHPKDKDIFSIITHPSIIRAMIDYVYIALKGKGSITIADAPFVDTDFKRIIQKTGFRKITKLYGEKSGVGITLLDLRKEWFSCNSGFIPERKALTGDPMGYVNVDLGRDSEFSDFKRFENLHYLDCRIGSARRYHNGKRNEYVLPRSVLSSDVIISLPKLKVHKKAGVTLNLKNMIGICGDKNCLAHFTWGPPSRGGDEIKDGELKGAERSRQYRQLKLFGAMLSDSPESFLKLYKSIGLSAPHPQSLESVLGGRVNFDLPAGDWYGNDTLWRTILDLNRIVRYADGKGRIRKKVQRRFFSLIDGIIAGEKEGPVEPSPRKCGVLIAGFDFVTVDMAAIHLMGFDYRKIPQYSNLTGKREKIVLPENVTGYNFRFKPPSGWAGNIERK
ncbi:MAG: DUF362 domain-containing protein [Elusimicrobia bacterium]|nr:DUF362 domain-containing protein [Elusimicrobiota bacterium]